MRVFQKLTCIERKCGAEVTIQKKIPLTIETHASLQDPSITEIESGSVCTAIYYNTHVSPGVRKTGGGSRDFSITWHNRPQTKDTANNSAKTEKEKKLKCW